MRALGIDLFCGLGGWTEGFLPDYDVVGFDIERHAYGEQRYPAQLVIQDVLTLHGSQFRNASIIVASPPCQEYSYMAMPWSRAKQIGAALRGDGDFPEGYTGSRTIDELNALFNACFRIQREACEAAGRHIPLIVENVRGAIPWVGRSRFNFGSFHFWGDVPALMPMAIAATKTKGHPNIRDGHAHTRHLTNPGEHAGRKQPGLSGTRENGKGDAWFQDGAAKHGSKSPARKAASAMIAKIPLPVSQHIAKVYYPTEASA
jgi:hypothetical protein